MKERADFKLRQGDGGKAKQKSQTAATKRCRGQLQTPVPSQKHEKKKKKQGKNSLVRVRTSFSPMETAETHESVQGETHAHQRHTKVLSSNFTPSLAQGEI